VITAEDRPARDDAGLMAKIAAGNRKEPTAELYRRHGQRLYWFGVQLLGDLELAGELVQESFSALWRAADQFDPGQGTVAAHLFVTARRISAGLRASPCSRPLALANGDQVPCDLDRIVDALAVQDSLTALSPANRGLLMLAYEQGLSRTQIAEQTGAPPDTVDAHLDDGLAALKAALVERGYPGGYRLGDVADMLKAALALPTVRLSDGPEPPRDLQTRTLARIRQTAWTRARRRLIPRQSSASGRGGTSRSPA